jgi:hypothetical protein
MAREDDEKWAFSPICLHQQLTTTTLNFPVTGLLL